MSLTHKHRLATYPATLPMRMHVQSEFLNKSSFCKKLKITNFCNGYDVL